MKDSSNHPRQTITNGKKPPLYQPKNSLNEKAPEDLNTILRRAQKPWVVQKPKDTNLKIKPKDSHFENSPPKSEKVLLGLLVATLLAIIVLLILYFL